MKKVSCNLRFIEILIVVNNLVISYIRLAFLKDFSSPFLSNSSRIHEQAPFLPSPRKINSIDHRIPFRILHHENSTISTRYTPCQKCVSNQSAAKFDLPVARDTDPSVGTSLHKSARERIQLAPLPFHSKLDLSSREEKHEISPREITIVRSRNNDR